MNRMMINQVREQYYFCSDPETRDRVYHTINIILDKYQLAAIGLSLRTTTTGLKLEICYE